MDNYIMFSEKKVAYLIFYNLQKPERRTISSKSWLLKTYVILHQTSRLLYFAIFQGSRNDVFSHVTCVIVNILFKKKTDIWIKTLYLLKRHTVQKLRKDVPVKRWNERNLWRLLKT